MGLAAYLFFPHRARAAFLAIALRRAALSLAALARPPFAPPSSPRATAAGFFCRVERWTMEYARMFTSLLLTRLGMGQVWSDMAGHVKRGGYSN